MCQSGTPSTLRTVCTLEFTGTIAHIKVAPTEIRQKLKLSGRPDQDDPPTEEVARVGAQAEEVVEHDERAAADAQSEVIGPSPGRCMASRSRRPA